MESQPDFSYYQELREQASFWRSFNRYYFHTLRGVRGANNGWGFHSTELRVLREIGEAGDAGVCNAYVAWKANIHKAQVTRIVNWFRLLGWIEDRRCTEDRRMKYFSLTPLGQRTFTGLERRSHDATESLLSFLMREDRMRLVAALSEVQGILAQVAGRADCLDPQVP